MVPKIANVTGFAAWAATASVLVLLACSTVPETQQPVAEMAPAESAPAAAPKNGAAPPAINNAPTTSECKGLEEKPCRKNRECVWIIPKEADKSGQIRLPIVENMVVPKRMLRIAPHQPRPRLTHLSENNLPERAPAGGRCQSARRRRL